MKAVECNRTIRIPEEHPGEEIMTIETVNDLTREAFYELAGEYLPDNDYEKVTRRERDYQKTYLLCLHEEQVVGVAFGWPRCLDDPSDSSFCLNGIAVREAYQKQGFGSELLRAVCDAAAAYGHKSISVGSAGGYVEKFYIDAGFVPLCYKAFAEEGIRVERVYRDTEDYRTYERKNPDGFVVLEKPLPGI